MYWPRITRGEEAGTTELSGSLVNYVSNHQGDFFDLDLLDNSPGLGRVEQVVIKDGSGWFVVGEAIRDNYNRELTPLTWYDAKKGAWRPISNFKPEGASSVELQGNEWIAINEENEVGWKFKPEIQEWIKTKFDISPILAEAGIEFPESSTSHLEREYGEFNYRVSKDLMDNIGRVSAQLPEDVLERMYLHAMGRYMLFTRNTDPERYKGFIELANEFREMGYPDGDGSLYTDWSIFRELAEEVLVKGPAPMIIKPQPYIDDGTLFNPVEPEFIENYTQIVNNLNMNFVGKEEFNDVIHILEDNGVLYFSTEPLTGPKDEVAHDVIIAVFVIGRDIEIVSYNNGWLPLDVITPHSNPRRFFSAPLERLSPGFDNTWYYAGMITLYRDALLYSQQFFYDYEDVEYFKPGVYYIETRFLRFSPDDTGCGTGTIFEGAKARECKDKAYLTFNP